MLFYCSCFKFEFAQNVMARILVSATLKLILIVFSSAIIFVAGVKIPLHLNTRGNGITSNEESGVNLNMMNELAPKLEYVSTVANLTSGNASNICLTLSDEQDCCPFGCGNLVSGGCADCASSTLPKTNKLAKQVEHAFGRMENASRIAQMLPRLVVIRSIHTVVDLWTVVGEKMGVRLPLSMCLLICLLRARLWRLFQCKCTFSVVSALDNSEPHITRVVAHATTLLTYLYVCTIVIIVVVVISALLMLKICTRCLLKIKKY